VAARLAREPYYREQRDTDFAGKIAEVLCVKVKILALLAVPLLAIFKINYFSNFYRTRLRPTLKRIDLYVIRWARRKYKRLRLQTKGARDWFAKLRQANPMLFAHWQLCHGNGRITGAV
jgi:hypothetical protein